MIRSGSSYYPHNLPVEQRSKWIYDTTETDYQAHDAHAITTWWLKGKKIWVEDYNVALDCVSSYQDLREGATVDDKPIQNCITCTNFMPTNRVPTRYGRQVGSPMCAKFDKPIGRNFPNGETIPIEEVGRIVGKDCPGYNKPANARPARVYNVAFPEMGVEPTTEVPGTSGDVRVNTCYSCKHYAQSDVVMAEWGWTTGACSRFGFLVPESNATQVGKNCDVSEFGMNRGSMLGVTLFPEYDEDYLTPDLVGDFIKANQFDPHTYETDRPVTDKQREAGIRAWYQVPDMERPELKTGIFLPIYDLDRYDAEERSKVPQSGDDEHPENYLDHNNAVYQIAALWVGLDESPALWGPPGVGKTELGRHLAWIMQLPFVRISITGSTELDDLAGKMHYVEGRGTEFHYGRLPSAWRRPGVVLIDEPNVGMPDVWQFLRPLTDNSKQLVLDMNEGERIDRHSDAFLLMAMNPAWDPRNVGTAVIGDADQRRLMHVSMTMPPPKIEEQIITTRCTLDGYELPKKTLRAIMAIAEELRGLSDQGTLPVSWGVASQVKVARATQYFSLRQAYKVAVGNFLEPQQADMILDVVKSHDTESR